MATSVPVVHIAQRSIGPDQRCFVIAEAGVNHDGSVERAHQLIDVAADAGADAVKFQTFRPALLAAPTAKMAAYQRENTGRDQTQTEMLSRLTLPDEAYVTLRDHAARRGILFLSSPFDAESADLLQRLDVPAFKIASGELTNHILLRHIAGKRRAVLLSTGMATEQEVAEALAVLRSAGSREIALFHCVTSYPADPADANLRAMKTMEHAFGVPVGWSDHSIGTALSLAAVALGASILEKHFTTDRNLPGPDHKASLEPHELRRLVAEVRAVEASLGDGVKVPRPPEIELAKAARRSLHASRRLRAGHVIAESDFAALRPGTGCSPARLPHIVGRRLRVDLEAGQMLYESDLD
jgi:N-acetylneuraminate synthase/N,N'-diacetyllegionaminate synthase